MKMLSDLLMQDFNQQNNRNMTTYAQ